MPAPYEYTGQLKGFLPMILDKLRKGESLKAIANTVLDDPSFRDRSRWHWTEDHGVLPCVRYIAKGYGFFFR
jgi:hypothetical protein